MKARLPKKSFIYVFTSLIVLLLLYSFGLSLLDTSGPSRILPLRGSMTGAIDYSIPTPVPARKPKLVLLLSSYGRSGSSFMAEILQSEQSNLYFFEPLKMLRERGIVLTDDNIIGLLKNLWNCQIYPDFMSWIEEQKRPTLFVRHKSFQTCKDCLHQTHLEKACQQETYIITKTIRMRLKSTKELVSDPTMDIKVIHLVRDPRASDMSMVHLKWNTNSTKFCPLATEDFYVRRQMEKEFPHKYHFVRYEDLCRNPFRITANIFRFLSGETTFHDGPMSEKSIQEDIPRNVQNFLRKHTNSRWSKRLQRDPYGTFRDTLNSWQKWRMTMDRDFLERNQNVCREIIQEAGYRMFSSLEELRNLSVSSLMGVS
ncbi:carbohydrate sulfotransferase 1-like isoform X2 [Oratosquilla oratoria]